MNIEEVTREAKRAIPALRKEKWEDEIYYLKSVGGLLRLVIDEDGNIFVTGSYLSNIELTEFANELAKRIGATVD